MSNAFSSQDNPFADPQSSNPFESSASINTQPTPQLSDREAALNAREAELARREAAIAAQGLVPNNFPPFYPLIHHDIATVIPQQHQALVTRLYQIWLALLATLVFNFIGGILLLIAGASDGAGDMIGAAVYVPVISVLSFFLWYRPIYYAYSKEYAMFYWIYFFFGGWHILFSAYMLIGIPSTGAAGLINTIAMAAQNHWAAFVFGVISSIGWALQTAGSLIFYRSIWGHKNEQGHTLDKAKGEVATQGLWAYIGGAKKM